MRFRFASRHISVADALRFITCATDSSLQIGNRNGSRKGAHQRLFGSKVDRGLEDAWHALQRFFAAADTRGAAHALSGEFQRLCDRGKAGLLDCLDDCNWTRDRKRIVMGKSGYIKVAHGGHRNIKKKKKQKNK